MKNLFGVVFTAVGLSALTLPATAETSVSIDTSVSTLLIDRGEALATLNNDFAITAQTSIGGGAGYVSVYRISPLGSEGEAFDEEVDYTLGYAFDAEAFDLDLSATYLTYPGNNDDASVELVASAAFSSVWDPTATAFYDADFEDYGLELSAGPSWDIGNWSTGLTGRLGFVEFGDGSGGYAYGGAEIAAERALNDALSLSLFARIEVADDDTFADRFADDEITGFSREGAGVGIALSWALPQ